MTLVLGALAGWVFGPSADTWFGPFGDLYVTLIKLIALGGRIAKLIGR